MAVWMILLYISYVSKQIIYVCSFWDSLIQLGLLMNLKINMVVLIL